MNKDIIQSTDHPHSQHGCQPASVRADGESHSLPLSRSTHFKPCDLAQVALYSCKQSLQFHTIRRHSLELQQLALSAVFAGLCTVCVVSVLSPQQFHYAALSCMLRLHTPLWWSVGCKAFCFFSMTAVFPCNLGLLTLLLCFAKPHSNIQGCLEWNVLGN